MVPDQSTARARRGRPEQAQLLAARLHFIPRLIRPLQARIVRIFRRYFERSPNWVLLTTIGRRTGLPREVLLPCERWRDALCVISTYGWRSDWIRNIGRNPEVSITCAGWIVPARAEIVEQLDVKCRIVSEHPFFPVAPVGILNLLHRTLLRPLWVPFLRWWVTGRPIVVIRPKTRAASSAE
ncbi:MAG TPA: nitroreductase/quinone reductase family protein [Candidatus Binatia bacterium]|nr:nitroreductase/quinone reductase family protein [Candidatus Binatia bacterium]